MNFIPVDMLPTQGPLLPTQCPLLPTQGPLLPTPWAGKSTEVYFTSEHSFMDLRFATSSSTDECDIIYLCKYILFRFTSHTLQFIWNGIYKFASNWNLGVILRIENRCTDCWMFARQISGLSDHSTHSAYSRAPAGALLTIDNGIFYQTFANVTSPLHFFFSFINGMFH